MGEAAGGGQDGDPGGRKRWRLGRKAAAQNPPEADAPDRNTGRRRGKRKAPDRNAPEQEAAAEYTPDPHASSAYRETAVPGSRRRGSARASGPYPGPSDGSAEYASGAGRGRVRHGGAAVPDERDWDYTSAERTRAGYSGTGYDGPGGSGTGDDGAGYSGIGDDSAERSGPARYGGTGYGRTGYGSGEYPQPGLDDARPVSRGRLPGDDDLLLPPPRRGAASGGYPAGAGGPATGSRPGRTGYPDAASANAPDHPGLAGPGPAPGDSPRRDPSGGSPAWGGYRDDSSRRGPSGGSPAWGGYPGDSTRSDPGGSSPAWSSPGHPRSVWEPGPGPWQQPRRGVLRLWLPRNRVPGSGVRPRGSRRAGVRPGLRVVLRHGIPWPRLSRPRGPLLQPCARGLGRRARRRASGG